MSKLVPVKDFELHNVKSKGKKGLHVQYFDKNRPNELWTVDSDGQPHEDLFGGLNDLKEVLAYSLGLSNGWDFGREHNRKNEELLKKAQLSWKLEIERCEVSGITVVGSEDNDNMGVKISGSLKTDLGTVGLTSPIIRFEDSFSNSVDDVITIGDLAETAFEKIKEQVWLFVFKGRRGGELDFPEEEDVNEAPKASGPVKSGGLNGSAKLEKVG